MPAAWTPATVAARAASMLVRNVSGWNVAANAEALPFARTSAYCCSASAGVTRRPVASGASTGLPVSGAAVAGICTPAPIRAPAPQPVLLARRGLLHHEDARRLEVVRLLGDDQLGARPDVGLRHDQHLLVRGERGRRLRAAPSRWHGRTPPSAPRAPVLPPAAAAGPRPAPRRRRRGPHRRR